MAFATAPGRAIQARTRQAALVLGSSQFASELRNLFARSHWELEWRANSDAALKLLNHREFPVVICEGDGERIRDRIRLLDDPPAVLAVVDQIDSESCNKAIRSGFLCLDRRQLMSGGLFPLLNHAWRMKNQD